MSSQIGQVEMPSTVTAPPTPTRSLEQRMSALRTANEIRTQRAKDKRKLRTLPKPESRQECAKLVGSPPPYMATMKVWDLLVAARTVGAVKANRILMRARISPSKTLGGMTQRQRGELADLLLEAQPA